MFRLLTIVFAFLLAVATALPVVGNVACKPNFFEHANLAHHHDVNTGKLLVGQTLSPAPKLGGSGCIPIWAGGDYDDSAHFKGKKYPDWILKKYSKASQQQQ